LIWATTPPITPRAGLLELAGRSFCVSFADPRDIEVCHEIGESVMLDNGAFSRWRQGKPTDWPGYYGWCDRWLDHWTTWAVIPDVIDGDEGQNDVLIAEWPFGDRGAPVWHLHESLERLARLCSEWPLVCLGSSGEYATPGAPAWHRRMADVMRIACDDRGRPVTRLHMLRGLGFAGGPYPFYSADSTNVARNHAGTNGGRARKSALRMASEIDGRQTPALWVPSLEQMELAVHPSG
jgi:hypothetical protein